MSAKGKPVTFNGVEYRTQAEAAKALGYSDSTISNYVNRGITDIPKNVPRRKAKKASGIHPITLNGVEYGSLTEAAKALGYSVTSISKYAKNGITEVEPRVEKKAQKRQKIVVDGVEYKSIHDAEITLYGKYTGRLYNRVLRGETEFTANPSPKVGAIEVVDSFGNKYNSISEMARTIGVKQGTVSKRLKRGTLNPPHKLPINRSINGKIKCHYWYDGVEYDSQKSAIRWLHHGAAWIKNHCVEICEYINRDTGLDEYKSDTYSVILAMYQHQTWDEDRVIAECDRRMKKLFAHGKLIKTQAR